MLPVPMLAAFRNNFFLSHKWWKFISIFHIALYHHRATSKLLLVGCRRRNSERSSANLWQTKEDFFFRKFLRKSSCSCGVPLKCAWSVWNDNQIFTRRRWLNSPGKNLLVDFHKRKIHVYNNSRICVTRSTARQFNKTTQFTMSYTAKMFVCTIFFCYFYFFSYTALFTSNWYSIAQ